MKWIFNTTAAVIVFAGMTTLGSAATTKMDGTISDSMCGTSHTKMMAMHKDAKMSDRDCTLACVKGGGKFVFVSGGKVYNITNQNLPALNAHAGETVSLAGTVEGDTITVSKISAKK